MSAATTRRALLGAIAAAPAIAALGIPATALAATADRAAWDRTFAAYKLAKAEDDAFTPHWLAASDRYRAMRPDMAEVIDWSALGLPYTINRAHTARVLDVEKTWTQYLGAEGKTWWAKDPVASKAKMRASLDSILRFRRLEDEANEASGSKAADERSEALGERVSDLDDELLAMPAPDGEALLWKLDRLFGVGDARDKDGYSASWCAAWVNAFMADANRLLASGRA